MDLELGGKAFEIDYNAMRIDLTNRN